MTLEMYVEDRVYEAKQAGIEETARNFLAMGFSMEQVAQGTGLSIEQLREIAAEINAEG